MAADTEKRNKECEMCGWNKLVPIPRPDGKDSSFVACPNCDNPKGTLPKLSDPI